MYDALTKEELNTIIKNMNNKEELLTIINEIVKDKYDLGFNDGYDVGYLECDDGESIFCSNIH